MSRFLPTFPLDKPKSPRRSPAQRFAGVYQLMEIANPECSDVEDDEDISEEYERYENYEIIVMNGNQIWFKDPESLFRYKGTLTLYEKEYIRGRHRTIEATVFVQNEQLIVREKTLYHYPEDELPKFVSRTHELSSSGDYLNVIDIKSSWTTGPIHKKYMRVKVPQMSILHSS